MSDAILQPWTARPEMRSGSRLPPRLRGAASLSRVALPASLVVGLFTVLAYIFVSIPSVPALQVTPAPTAAASVTPAWIEIIKPVRIYSLEARDLAKLTLTYAARRRGGGASATREDLLVYGAWRADQPSLRLSMLRNGTGPAVSLDTAIVRQAADVGLSVGHSTLPETLSTRFGDFEIADVEATLHPGAALRCSGFRLHIAKPALAVDGFACGADGHVIAKRALGCLIDRLDLASAGDDKALADFFAATDLKRDARCDGMRLGPDLMHAAWLDEKESAPTPPAHHRMHRRH